MEFVAEHMKAQTENQTGVFSLMNEKQKFRLYLHHKFFIVLGIVLATLYSSILFTLSATGYTEPLTLIVIFTVLGFFIGPVFVCALGSCLFRKKSALVRISAGISTFFVLYGIESVMYLYQHGDLAEYGIYPRSVLYSELLFYPAYIVLSFTLSAMYLYERFDSQRWRNFTAPMICALIVLVNIIPIDFVDTHLIFLGIALLSIGSALGLPSMHRKMVESLGDVGHHTFFVVLLGYISTLCIAAQIQLLELLSSDPQAYAILIQSNVNLHQMDFKTRATILAVTNWLGKISLVFAALFLGAQMKNKSASFYAQCQNVCLRTVQGILPCVCSILVLLFVFEPWAEVQIDLMESGQSGTTDTGDDYLSIYTTSGEGELIVFVCGENEHAADYSRRINSSTYGLESESDQFSISRTALLEMPDLPYLSQFELELECSQLVLSPNTTWTSASNTITITNSSVSYLHIDSGKATNVQIIYEDNETQSTRAAYSLCVWFVLLPILCVYFYKRGRSEMKLELHTSVD